MSDKTFDIRQCTVFKGASVGVRVCVRVCVRAGVRVYFFGFFCLLNLLRKVCVFIIIILHLLGSRSCQITS